MRILVIEDDDVLREGLADGLALEGHTVDMVADCADAREAVAGFTHDAIVLDIGLPDGSELDLLREWRRAGRATPSLLLPARHLARAGTAGIDRGSDDSSGQQVGIGGRAARLRRPT